jgi:N-ethylmaleimide reductase
VLEGDMMTRSSAFDYRALRWAFGGTYIANNGYDLRRAQTAIRGGAVDLVAFGHPFIANPDLVRRYRENLPLNEPDPSTFYGGGEKGYTDYPVYRSDETRAA